MASLLVFAALFAISPFHVAARYLGDRSYSTIDLVETLARGHYMRDRSGRPLEGIPVDFECEWRKAAMSHAHSLQPFLSMRQQKQLFDALELGSAGSDGHHPHPVCANETIAFKDFAWDSRHRQESIHKTSSKEIHVSSVDELVDALERAKGKSTTRTVIRLGAGTYRLNKTLVLGPEHSNFTLAPAEAGGEVIFSGAQLLSGLTWKKVQLKHRGIGDANANIWSAQVPSDFGEQGITSLRVNGLRATRARFPNANPEVDHFPIGYVTAKTEFLPPTYKGPTVNISIPIKDAYPLVETNSSAWPKEFGPHHFAGAYRMGYNGSCSVLSPAKSYWCQPDGRVAGELYHVRTPSGIRNIYEHLPNGPYKDNGKDMVVTYWRPGHWFSVMYNLSKPITDDEAVFGIGGFQGAEGHDSGAEWFIENVLEELDAPNEFFYDQANSRLLFYFNGSGPPPTEIEVPVLTELLLIRGSEHARVENLRLINLTFTGQRPTYLEPHGLPSAGDWGLPHLGAVHLNATVNTTVEGCTFARLDGNAVFLDGYNRGAAIRQNEFVSLGGSAIALWGSEENGNGEVRGGEQPRGTLVEQNFCHEIGIYQKQSSCFFQAVAAQSIIQHNIFFNGPRAMVNFNDGFGGANDLGHNLIFNTCRESSDHGAFNSWGRQPYLTSVKSNGATLSAEPAYSRLHNNFIVANYAADGGCFDNDDGSSWYLEQNNFCIYGGMKSNFEGSNKRSSNNVHAFAAVYGDMCLNGINQVSEHYAEGYWNNTCILNKAGDTYLHLLQLSPSTVKEPSKTELHTYLGANVIYAPEANVKVDWKQLGMSMNEWMQFGLDVGTVVKDSAGLSSAEIMKMGLEVLKAPNGPAEPGIFFRSSAYFV